MAIRFDAAGDRVYLAATLPAPGSGGLTIVGWWRIRVDLNAFSVYYRTSGSGGTPTIHSVSAHSDGVGVSVYTTSGELNSAHENVVDQWVGIAVVDGGAGVTQYVQPYGGATVAQAGAIGSGTPAHFCVGGRSISDATERFDGNAAHVRVFADALTQAEVEAEWASATPVLTAWADYPFIDNIQDASGNARHLTVVSGTPTFETGPVLGSDETATPIRSRVLTPHARLVRGRHRASRRPS